MRFLSSSVSKLAALLLLTTSVAISGCAADASDEAGGDPESEESEIAKKTTLTFFLVGREYNETTEEWKDVSLDSLNPDLEHASLPTFHKAITLGAQDGAKFTDILKRLETANTKLHRKVEFDFTWDPSEYKGLCYNGTAAGVMKTVDGLRGRTDESAFSEYMGVQSYRYGSKKKVFNSTETEWLRMQREDNEQGDTIKAWETFDTRSNGFLMFTDGGQQGDGTELFAVLIPKCG